MLTIHLEDTRAWFADGAFEQVDVVHLTTERRNQRTVNESIPSITTAFQL